MIVEIGIISFMPRIDPSVVFLVNRILSGLAEAAASGADEALAYDSLKQADMADSWGRVLELLMRYQAAGFVVAMITGAAVYDPKFMGQMAQGMGLGIEVTQEVTMRFPLFLTFILALLGLVVPIPWKIRSSWQLLSGFRSILSWDFSVWRGCVMPGSSRSNPDRKDNRTNRFRLPVPESSDPAQTAIIH
jgi:hypothetical protein